MNEARPRASRPVRPGVRVLALAFGLALAFLLVESILRVRLVFTSTGADPLALARTVHTLPPPYRGHCDGDAEQALLGAIVRPTDTPDLVYALKPDLDTCYYGARIRTNADGLRGERVAARPKPPGTVRVLLLGDSYTFGQGVEFEETFGRRLEAMLAEAHPGHRFEVVNAGVDGYNLFQEAAWLREIGVSYEPDLVIVLFVGNDLDLPFFLYSPDPPLALDRSYTVELIARLLGRAPPGGTRPPIPVGARIPDRYAHMAGVAGYEAGLETLAALARQHGFTVVDFVDEPLAREVWGGASARDATRALEARLGLHAPRFTMPTGHPLNADNLHPNAVGHRLIAERIMAGLAEIGWTPPGASDDAPDAPAARAPARDDHST